MKMTLPNLFACICAFIPALVFAGEQPLKLSTNTYYTVTLYTPTTNAYMGGGVYCREKDGRIQKLNLIGTLAKCAEENQFRMNQNILAGTIVNYGTHINGIPNFTITKPNIPVFGRLYFSFIQGKLSRLTPAMRTYFFDAKPGTITVVPLNGQGPKDAIQAARKSMLARGYVGLDKFKFQVLRAAVIQCKGSSGTQKCKLGQGVGLFKHTKITEIVVAEE